MPHITLEGETLGERHRYYNNLVKKAITDNRMEKLDNINYHDSDVDNLLRIDVASHKKNVEYILEVLKSEDMLYISRALKQSTWLITDQQYAHIINPSYLHKYLFPHMNKKAIKKLMLHVRLNLKDEKRIKAFYSYHLKVNPKAAVKWLLKCPINFILRGVKRHHQEVPIHVLKRLCRKSPQILKDYLAGYVPDRDKVLSSLTFLAKSNTNLYLDIIDSTASYYLSSFGVKATQYLLIKCPDRIINNFAHYADYIDLPTFVKHIKRKGVKDFILNESIKGKQEWFNFNILKHFLVEIPRNETFDLLKTIFRINDDDMKTSDLYYAIEKSDNMTPANVYRWYEFAPFHIAKYELPKLIYAESSPEERQSILSVFLACAGRDPHLIQIVLEYYHERHINEPYKFKITFVNDVLDKTNYHRFDDKTWDLLNELFHSMEVYIESENEVAYCVDAIIIYKSLHGHHIPDVIKEKFQYDTLKYFQKKLNEDEKEKIFNFLYDYETCLFKEVVANETDLNENVTLLQNIWTLIKEWDKEQHYYQVVTDKIKELMHVKERISSTVDLSCLYTMMGRWRRLLFSESLSLCCSEQSCLNVLKHSPRLLKRHSAELSALRAHETATLRRLLSKLRIYWPHTIAHEWNEEYLARINDIAVHKALIQGLYGLLPAQKLTDFIKTHAPGENKKQWKEVDEIEVSLRKHIAKNMHRARPTLSIDIVLEYAKSPYLKNTQLSLNTLCSNHKLANSQQYVQKLLKARVSLQKYGIRIAFHKMKPSELTVIFSQVWKATKNRSIRVMIFTMTFELLCKETKLDLIKELWKVISLFIDELTYEENRKIYDTLANISSVPLCIRAEFYVKSYMFMKSLPQKTGCSYQISSVISYAVEIMEYLDNDFVVNNLLQSFCDKFLNGDYTDLQLMSVYLLCSQNQKIHAEKCEQFLDPILKKCWAEWNKRYHLRFTIDNFLKHLYREMPKIFDRKMVLPVLAFTKILEFFEKIWTIEENYTSFTSWKLTISFIKMLEDLNTSKGSENGYSWNEIIHKSISYFAEICKQQLLEDMNKYFPSIYLLFGDSLKQLLQVFGFGDTFTMELIGWILDEEIIQTYLLGMQILPRYMWDEAKKRKRNELRQKIYTHESVEVKMHYLLNFNE